jgi:sugar phosphate isomerase/epimerase
MCQKFDFEYFRKAKLTRVGVHNPGFHHWQLFLCPEDKYQNIASRIRQNNSSLSLHHPFIVPYKQQNRHHSSLFLDALKDRREGSFAWLENSLEKAVELGAEFVVTHLNHGEGVNNMATARKLADEAMSRFAELSRSFKIPVHVEFLGYHSVFHDPGEFVDMLTDYPELSLCLDSGHLHRHGQIHDRNPYDSAEKLALLVGSIHLWNISSHDEYLRRGHIPVHPEHCVEDGYLDIEKILRTVLAMNRNTTVIFEPSVPEGTTEEYIREGIEWVRSIVANCAASR